ncbi:ABC transporter ATP-binding protein [Conexibacter sp. CPCC 206217]|uniref:dipeptide ABC transporter ATP-binding protein n=1 Tax=Conexibacter sp. CPCC 206217 TaxID=3064574 RepID=UPI0027157B5E|nr:ABC transporter ATP-binding protein [Conexibacter sp. CPCC 206217]MDO8212147.1 ABC transporter ATP-binding protein [Conexibacter sp. CPCC 206217]
MSAEDVTRRDLLRVENLRVGFGDRRAPVEVVRGISFALAPGSCLAIVGESGSGKSVTARSLVGLTGGRSQVAADRIELDGRDLLRLRDRQWRAVRGAEVGFVLQDALVSLDQLRPVGREIAEPLRLHRWGTREQRRARVVELLRQVGVPEPELRARQLPHELSGGLRQRALIASAIALDPKLIVADEPTTALDVTIQAQVLELLAQTKQRGSGLILISHDLAVVAQMADHVAVMRAGEIVEHGPAREVLRSPRHAYTQALLDAIPSMHSKGTRLAPGRGPHPALGVRSRPLRSGTVPVLRAEGLVKRYRGPDGVTRTVVDDVSFELSAGETLGIVGESGSGKTTAARIALALVEPDAGSVLLDGRPWSGVRERDRRDRRRQITVVYQDPLSSFDPRWTVERIVDDALSPSAFPSRELRRARVGELLEQVGLPQEHRARRPLQLSGGQRQRVAIARAIAPDPAVIVCDEPVSALDVSIQAQVLDLLADLQTALGVSYLFISHDLGVIHHMSDRVLVLNDGRVVEQGSADEVFLRPREPYTRRLVASLPTLERPQLRAVARP